MVQFTLEQQMILNEELKNIKIEYTLALQPDIMCTY